MSCLRPRVQALLAAIVTRAALSLGVVRPWQLARSDQERIPQEQDSFISAGNDYAPQVEGTGSRESGWPQLRTSMEHKVNLASTSMDHKVKLAEQGHARKHKSTFKRVKPLIQIPGNVSRWQRSLNLVDEMGFHKQLGGSFSLMCTLQMEQISPWQRVFDFSFAADIDSITAGALSNTTHLHFTIFKGKTKSTVKVWDFFEPGKRITALFTVNSSGRMRIWKNGQLAAEVDGHAPIFNDRPHLIIGGHYLYKRQFFHGVIGNVKIWSKEVVWPPAPGTKPINFARQLEGGVSVGGPSPLSRKKPRATTTAPPTPAPHAWSRILTDDREQDGPGDWINDQPRRVMRISTTTPIIKRFQYVDNPDDESQTMEEGPPLPRPPPQHWN